ncbi:MAG TPA: beta-eliminating lyase-related protein [Ktedonobacterales bacterium]|jgi:threonine aldolase
MAIHITTSDDTSSAQPLTEDEKRAIFLACERSLSGHVPHRPAETLVALAREAADTPEPDHYGEGAVIEDFEREIATLLGKEAAVFMPSGTMAQQIALRIWSERKNCSTVAFHPLCHLEVDEEKAYQYLHNLRARLVGSPQQLLTLDDLRKIAEPLAALLLELPQRYIGGQLPEWDDLVAQTQWARERGAALHMDGARLWESGPYYVRPYAEIAALFDSVYVSFYKGVGGIAGAALSGPADFIAEARVWLRRHGGNLVHLYPYVLAARMGLRERLDRFPAHHERAKEVAAALQSVPGVVVKPGIPQTHMMHVYLPGDKDRMLAESLAIARKERVSLVRWLAPTELPGYVKFEVAIGEAAFALTDEEIAGYFARIVAAGQE